MKFVKYKNQDPVNIGLVASIAKHPTRNSIGFASVSNIISEWEFKTKAERDSVYFELEKQFVSDINLNYEPVEMD